MRRILLDSSKTIWERVHVREETIILILVQVGKGMGWGGVGCQEFDLSNETWKG